MQHDIVAGFIAELLQLRALCGAPTLKELVALTSASEHPLARSTISDKLNAKSVPDWDFVLSFVTACVQYAEKRSIDPPGDLSNLDRWDTRHWRMLSELDSGCAGERLLTTARTLIGQRVALRMVPRELPAGVSGFTGRMAELARVDAWLAAAATTSVLPIMVLSGPPGVGKSALAVRWGHSIADRFPDGQIYLDLSGPLSPGKALAALLESVGVNRNDMPADMVGRARRYRTTLTCRRTLIVLDNAHAADQVRPLLPGSASCLVVVTSRFDLAGLVARDGARRIDIGPLPQHDSILLLRNLLGPRVDEDPAGAAAIANLCGGHPLALRVAAEKAMAQLSFRESAGSPAARQQ